MQVLRDHNECHTDAYEQFEWKNGATRAVYERGCNYPLHCTSEDANVATVADNHQELNFLTRSHNEDECECVISGLSESDGAKPRSDFPLLRISDHEFSCVKTVKVRYKYCNYDSATNIILKEREKNDTSEEGHFKEGGAVTAVTCVVFHSQTRKMATGNLQPSVNDKFSAKEGLNSETIAKESIKEKERVKENFLTKKQKNFAAEQRADPQ